MYLYYTHPVLSMYPFYRLIKLDFFVAGSYMMAPVKSVTALIGISNQKEDRSRSCARCALDSACPYRKRGERCGR